ncbi:hypothetical protein HUU62_10510 [Rhodoferax sp. 4810]|nr:hypothetical protein [Rhodoferax jenense]
MGTSSPGTGLPILLLGLLGVDVGLREGLEFNVLGLDVDVDVDAWTKHPNTT